MVMALTGETMPPLCVSVCVASCICCSSRVGSRTSFTQTPIPDVVMEQNISKRLQVNDAADNSPSAVHDVHVGTVVVVGQRSAAAAGCSVLGSHFPAARSGSSLSVPERSLLTPYLSSNDAANTVNSYIDDLGAAIEHSC